MMSINITIRQRNRLCTALSCLLAVLSTIARADDRKRGAVEDDGPSTEGYNTPGLPGPWRMAWRMTVMPVRHSSSSGVAAGGKGAAK